MHILAQIDSNYISLSSNFNTKTQIRLLVGFEPIYCVINLDVMSFFRVFFFYEFDYMFEAIKLFSFQKKKKIELSIPN